MSRTLMKVISDHFQKKSPKIVSILAEINFEEWFENQVLDDKQIFYSLCRTIVGQQLAGKAADAIFKRFVELFAGEVTPVRILGIEEQKIRDAGLSWAKVRSVRDLSAKTESGELTLKNLEYLGDEELIAELSKVKGIGRWTAEMFLMFRLGREDIFSWGDLGLKNGLKKFLKNPDISEAEMKKVVERWAPYRTYGAIAMWYLLDNR